MFSIYHFQTELITSKGYPCEQHNVLTKDGYILSLQRIPFSKKSPTRKGMIIWIT